MLEGRHGLGTRQLCQQPRVLGAHGELLVRPCGRRALQLLQGFLGAALLHGQSGGQQGAAGRADLFPVEGAEVRLQAVELVPGLAPQALGLRRGGLAGHRDARLRQGEASQGKSGPVQDRGAAQLSGLAVFVQVLGAQHLFGQLATAVHVVGLVLRRKQSTPGASRFGTRELEAVVEGLTQPCQALGWFCLGPGLEVLGGGLVQLLPHPLAGQQLAHGVEHVAVDHQGVGLAAGGGDPGVVSGVALQLLPELAVVHGGGGGGQQVAGEEGRLARRSRRQALGGIVSGRLAGESRGQEGGHHLAQEGEGEPPGHRAVAQHPVQAAVRDVLEHPLHQVEQVYLVIAVDLPGAELRVELQQVGEQAELEG